MSKLVVSGNKYGSTEGDHGESEVVDNKKQCGDGLIVRIYPSGFCNELKPLLSMSWPLVLTILTQYSFGLVAVFFCGHLGKVELDTMGLANSLINVFGLSISIGMSSACDTLFSQIYGSKNKTLYGVILQRSLLVLFIAIIPCLAIHLNAQNLLILTGQDPLISALTGDYLLIFIPALLSFGVLTAVSKYLQNMKIVYPSMIFGIIANVTNAVLHYVLIYVVDWGLTGSAIAQTISYILMLILNAAYIMISGIYKETWTGWSWECLEDWGQFAKLALFGLLMTCIEWWAFEVGIFLSGVMGETELGAQSVMFQFESILYMVPYGVAIAASVCVGTYLGEGKPNEAKTIARVGITIAVIIGVVFAIVIGLARNSLPVIFTNVPEVIALTANALPVLAMFTVFDATACVSGGVVRGMGRQYVGAIVIAIGYFIALCVGIPALLLTELSVAGFWLGLATALILVSGTYVIFLSFRDWDEEVRLAKERAKEGSLIESTPGETDMERGKKKMDEKTALLCDQDHDVTETSFNNEDHSLDYKHYLPVSTKSINLSTKQLLLRRGFTCLLCLGILVIGILCRFLFPPAVIPFPIPMDDIVTSPSTVTYGV